MKAEFFSKNRGVLAARIKGGVLVCTAHTKMQLAADITAPFKQESNFYYLTGITDPDWTLVLDAARGKSYLVAPDVSDVARVFEGALSDKDALAISGVDEVLSARDMDAKLRELARVHAMVHALGRDPHAKHYDFTLNPAPQNLWRKLERIFTSVIDVRSELESTRAIKQPEEIAAHRRAIKLTTNAFMHAKNHMNDYKYEYEIEADFTHAFRRAGAMHAYTPIVASGAHANTLHYTKNAARLRKGQLVLIDIGACSDGYAADITRTYAHGDVPKRARDLHAAVVHAHRQIIALLRPGLSVSEYLAKVDDIMVHACIELGLLRDTADERYRTYFPHAISHGLGLDVHDSLGRPTEFMPNMLVTVEPGIYVPEWNAGVRIEDDILITARGAENLSKSLDTSH